MAIISLRAYNREIEGLIDNGQLDEAVAHCRHILATFPKYIATYRLLGKAHLEQQRISDATDIFQRVLSAIPDDFTANVGMSIIREDENNLDASIWHMELAYEAQPSNIAIQDELRRLYGRRDGMQPPKVRLTRGALARMYAKGGLFDQAIAELRAAITEDPNRPDLQLLLAQMYFQMSQRVDAVETCVNILKKLPFCLSANQILAVCLPEAEKSAGIKNYRQTAITMDPYYAFADLDAISSDQVPENAVNIEKIEWKPGIQASEVTQQPNWATSLGISLEKPSEEKIPDWLQEAEVSAAEEPTQADQSDVSPFLWDTQEVKNIITDESKPEEEIPEWMQDAGWKPSSGEAAPEQNEAVPELVNEDTHPEELAKADIPDWLRGLAPEGMLDDELPPSKPKEEDLSLPWLEKQQPGPTDSIIQWLEENKPETPVVKTEAEFTPTEATDEEVPDWLRDLDTPSAAQEEKPVEQVGEFVPQTPAFIEEPSLVELAPVASETLPVQPSQEGVEDVPPAPEPETQPANPSDELPDWIKELAGVLPKPTPSETPEQELREPISSEEEPFGDIQSILKEIAAEELLASAQAETESKEKVDEFPPVEIPSAFMDEPTLNASVVEESPLQEVPAPTIEPSLPEQPAEIELPSAATETPLELESLAWLEEVAAEGTTEEKELVPPSPEEKSTQAEWTKLESEVGIESMLPDLESTGTEAPALPAEEIPEWIKGLGEIPEEEIREEEITTEAVQEAQPEVEIPKAEELPSWLSDLEPAEEEKETGEVSEALAWKEEEEIPNWIKEVIETAPATEAPAPVEESAVAETPVASAEQVEELNPETVKVNKLEEIPSAEPVETLDWIAEIEAIEPPATTPTVEPEAVSVPIVEEIAPAEVEAPAVPTPEAEVTTVTESPQVDLAKLGHARDAINNGFPTQAAELYTSLVRLNLHLEEVLKDLQDAIYRFPVDVNLWVALGDAYFKTEALQQALDTYTKAEDLVR